MRANSYCFTINNYTDEDIHRLRNLTNPRKCSTKHKHRTAYIVFQEEKGQEGTKHIQGYIEFNDKLRFELAKDIIGKTAHIERRKGTRNQAKDYCKKKDTRKPNTTPFEDGAPILEETKKEQERNFLEDITDLSLKKEEIIQTNIFPYLKLGARFNEVRETLYNKRNTPPEIHIFFGETGTGKSYTAHKLFPEAYNAPWPTGGRWWWPNYQHEDTVILDEFRQQIPYAMMLQFFDSGPFTIEYKGGNQQFTSKTIILTTNIPYEDWYKHVPNRKALYRRLQDYATIWNFLWDNPFGEKKDENGNLLTHIELEYIDNLRIEKIVQNQPPPQPQYQRFVDPETTRIAPDPYDIQE